MQLLIGKSSHYEVTSFFVCKREIRKLAVVE